MIDHPDIESQELTCEACPVQYEGRLKDGRYFYFRFRFGRAQLGVASTPEMAVEVAMMNWNMTILEPDSYRGFFHDDAERDSVFALLLGFNKGDE